LLGHLFDQPQSQPTTHVAFVALLLGTQIFMSVPSPSYAACQLCSKLSDIPVICTPTVIKPNKAQAALSMVKASFDSGSTTDRFEKMDDRLLAKIV